MYPSRYFTQLNFKGLLLITAILIGVGTLIYTNILVRELKVEEQQKVALWANASNKLKLYNLGQSPDNRLAVDVVESNKSIPVIITNGQDSILDVRNIEFLYDGNNSRRVLHELEVMKSKYGPIVMFVNEGEKQYIYHNDSRLLVRLKYYPYILILIIGMFMLIAYFAMSSAKESEQNRVWVGMAKETAHQLGTPISSLMAWVELLRMQDVDASIVDEIAKDTNRLNRIVERFSKVGSAPELRDTNIVSVLASTVEYLEARSPKRVHYTSNFNPYQEVRLPLNGSLFSWVIENLCRNAIDAIDGEGEINISLFHTTEELYVDVRDTGKGISKASFREIFTPGFTTKKRGWGLGLSLAKRIVDNYHNGRIFVKHSETGKGTTFRIILQLQGVSVAPE